jgi:hypothetical protein
MWLGKRRETQFVLEALTKVLNVLVRKKSDRAGSSTSAGLCAGAHGLVNDDTIGNSSCNESSAVRDLSGTCVVVHSQPRKAISDRCEDQGKVSIIAKCLSVTYLAIWW